MRICFFGVGGVGGYFGAHVAKRFTGQHEVYFIARGQHKAAIVANGLTLKKAGGQEMINVMPDICTDTTDDIPVCDVIVLSVKSYDLGNAINEIAKISDDKTIILPLLNGVDIYERIREHLAGSTVLRSCVYVGTHIESPGVIYQKGGSCRILYGNDPQNPTTNLDQLKSLLSESEIDFSHEEIVDTAIWSKFMFIAAYGLVTATYGKTVGQVLADENLKNKAQSIMEEIKSIADALKVLLPDSIVQDSLQKANDFPFETKTSFQRDVESKGKVNEADLFGGTIIRLGDKLAIPVPATKEVYSRFMNLFN